MDASEDVALDRPRASFHPRAIPRELPTHVVMRFVASHQDTATTRQRLEDGETFVATAGDLIVGIVTLKEVHATHGTPFYNRPDVADFGQFAVRPSYQRHDIGSRLIELVERRAREKGVRELALNTSEHAAHLVAMYTGKG